MEENKFDKLPIVFDKILAHHLYKLTILMRRYFIDTLREYDLTPEQWQILAVITEMGPDVPQSFFSKVMANDRHTISRTISNLEKRGWVTKAQKEDDKKSYYLSLTKQAQDQIPRIRKTLDASAVSRFSVLSQREYEQFLKLTKKLSGAFLDFM